VPSLFTAHNNFNDNGYDYYKIQPESTVTSRILWEQEMMKKIT